MPRGERRKIDLNKPKDRKSALLMCFIGVATVTVGIVTGYLLVFKPVKQIKQSQDWIKAPCTIKSVHRERTHKGSYIVVSYTYEFEGQTYESDRYGFSGNADDHKDFRRPAPGTESICFVNPDNPAETVITREYAKTFYINILLPSWFLVLGITFTLVPGLSLIIYYKKQKMRTEL